MEKALTKIKEIANLIAGKKSFTTFDIQEIYPISFPLGHVYKLRNAPGSVSDLLRTFLKT